MESNMQLVLNQELSRPSQRGLHDYKDYEDSRNQGFISVTASKFPNNSRRSQCCPCQCHTRSQASSPKRLQNILGLFFYNYLGSPVFGRRTCDFPQCYQSGNNVSIFYLFLPCLAVASGTDSDKPVGRSHRQGSYLDLKNADSHFITTPDLGLHKQRWYDSIYETIARSVAT